MPDWIERRRALRDRTYRPATETTPPNGSPPNGGTGTEPVNGPADDDDLPPAA